MKQLPERYTKIWRYMTDSNAPINEGRIAGMLEEVFVGRLAENKDILKSNLKTMKVKENFDLRGDGWMQSLIQHWEYTFMPDLSDELKRIKAIPDIKDRAPAMRAFLRDLSTGTTPMNVLSIMEDEFRSNREQLHEPVEEFDVDEGPGFLRRAAGGAAGGASGVAKAAGRGALAATGALAMSGRNAPMLATMARGALGAFGLARVAGRAVKTRVAGSSRLQSSILGKVFGLGKSGTQVRPKVSDFTPKEEQLEGGSIQATLNKIEENTAKMLELFAGKGMRGDKEGSGGFLGSIASFIPKIMSTVGSSLLALLGGPAMMAAMTALGGALAAAFGAAAYMYMCNKFPWMCDKNKIFDSMGQAVLPGVEKFAKKANELTGRDVAVERRRAQNMSVAPLEDRAAKVHDKLAAMEFGDGLGPKKKFSPEQIAGIMTSLKGESSTLDPRAVNEIGATGIAQWLGPRKDALFKFAEGSGRSPYDLETQLDFLEKEGNSTHKKVIQKILKAKTPEEAARLWTELYEVPFHPKTQAKELEAEQQRRLKALPETYAQVTQRQATKHVGMGKGGLEWQYDIPTESTSKAFTPKSKVSMDAAVKDIEVKISKEQDPVRRAQLVKARDALAGRSSSADIAPTGKPRSAPTLEVPATQAAPSSSAGAPIIINPTPAAKDSAPLPGNVSKFNDDRSYLALIKDSGNVMFPQFG